MALEFDALNAVPNEFTPLGKMRIDISGLMPGNYGAVFLFTNAVVQTHWPTDDIFS